MFQDHRSSAIRYLAIDLHAAIDRAGMHDQGVGPGFRQPRFVETEEAGIFAETWKHRLALTLVLNAEQVDDVGLAYGIFDVISDTAAHFFEHARDECGRSA